MPLRMWSYDIAREQCPTLEHLSKLCRFSLDSGYNALGLYCEHRFAYPSALWAAGKGALEPDTVRTLQTEFPELQIIPMINLLGHMEGFLYTEQGFRFAEERFKGMQACPSNPEFVAFAKQLLDDTLAIFKSEIIHIGGDETQQLGCCPLCRKRVEDAAGDGKALIYAEHFAPMAEHVLAAGRRPAVWGDMLLEHPEAMRSLPKETLVFDWQYFNGCLDTGKRFIEAGFDLVCCPTLHTYNAPWLHLLQSEENVRQCAADAAELHAFGVCVTTWECALFGAYDTLLPALKASSSIIEDPAKAPKSTFSRAYGERSEAYETWAKMIGSTLQEVGGVFAFSRIRNSLKCRFLLYSNPFLAWLHHREELSGPAGDQALAVLEEALLFAPTEAEKGVTLFIRSAIEFVRIAETAHLEYAEGRSEQAIARLALTRLLFDKLAAIAKATHERIGGSLADIERCRIAREHVEKVIVRIRQSGDGQLGYLPSFEMLTHPKFVPHDQAGWWLINKWANE